MVGTTGVSVPQGVISTQLDRIQQDRQPVQQQTAVREPEPVEEPTPPPAETGRGTRVDTTA